MTVQVLGAESLNADGSLGWPALLFYMESLWLSHRSLWRVALAPARGTHMPKPGNAQRPLFHDELQVSLVW
jgi:hypothetical protein